MEAKLGGFVKARELEERLEAFEEKEGKRGMRLRYVFAVVSAAVFVGLVAWAYQAVVVSGNKDGQVPLVKAEAGPIKINPEDPGGVQIPHQDSLIYDLVDQGAARDEQLRFEGQETASSIASEPDGANFQSMQKGFVLGQDADQGTKVESLFAPQDDGVEVPAPTALQNPPKDSETSVENLKQAETPLLDKADIESARKAIESDLENAGQNSDAVVPDEKSVVPSSSVTASEGDDVAAVIEATESVTEPVTESVAELAAEPVAAPVTDSGIIIHDGTEQASVDVLKAPAPMVKPSVPADFKEKLAAPAPIKTQDDPSLYAPYTPKKDPLASVPQIVADTAAGRMASVVDEGAYSPSASAPTPPAPVAVNDPAASAQIAPAAGGDTHYIQLASLPNETTAHGEWQNLLRRYPDVLGRSGVRFQSADLGDRGIYTRIQAGPFSETAARSACADLDAAGKPGGCIVVRK